MDVNPLQRHIMASVSRCGGAPAIALRPRRPPPPHSNAETFIWDLNAPSTHLPPGTSTAVRVMAAKAPAFDAARNRQAPEDLTAVAWNRVVPHVLAVGTAGGRTQLWDLRAGKTVLTLPAPAAGAAPVTALAWQPDAATTLASALGSDARPVVQLWDLRGGLAPQRELARHSRAVLALDWCTHDAGLLLSGGRDHRVLVWDPATGERARELPPAAMVLGPTRGLFF